MFQPELAAVARLAWMVWLLFSSILTVFGSQSSWSIAPYRARLPRCGLAEYAYDGHSPACFPYDGSARVSPRYDGAGIHTADEFAGQPASTRPIFAVFAEFLAAKSGIGVTGQVGEDALKALGGESQVYFRTAQGGRYVDQLVNGIANESKVGYQSLTPTISGQIGKDVELINSGQIQGSTWHFFQSPVTGVGGPSQPLLNTLQQNGINVIIHP